MANLKKFPCQNDSVSFSGTGIDGSRMRHSLVGLPCPCCGIIMLNSKDLKQAVRLPENAPSEEVLKVLNKYEKNLHPIEKDILKQLKFLSVIHPEYNLRELLDTQRECNLFNLHNEETKIINRMRKIGASLSERSRSKLEKTLTEAEQLIDDSNIDTIFKRKAFIGKIKDATYYFPEKDAAKEIVAIARELPRAGNNTSAFIVKFTQKKPATGLERTSHDIINALLTPSIGTIEHVKVKSPIIPNGGGANEMGNYLLECKRDNNMRDSMPLAEFVKKHPEFYGQNLQKYIDAIIRKIKRREIRNFDDYPMQIAHTLFTESDGAIKVDLSNL